MKNLFVLFSIVFSSLSVVAQSWYEVSVDATTKLTSIDFPSSSVGYIVGDSGVMLKTVDGGVNWDAINYTGIQIPVDPPNFSDIDFVDELTGFLVVPGVSPGVYKTIDGGLTWVSDETTSNMCFKNCVYPMDADNWFLGGSGCFQSAMVDKQTPAGWSISTVNYESFNPGEIVMQMDFNGTVGLAAMAGQYMLRSADSGATWDTIPTGLSGFGFLTSVMFATADTCYAGYDDNGGGFGVLKSTDAGLTWEQDINSATFFYPSYLSVGKAANGDVYLGARPSNWPNGLIFETTDGVNWLYEEVDQAINSIASYGNDVTFAVGDSGYVVVNTLLGNLGTDEMDLNEINVFPNPTMDKLNIVFEESPTYLQLTNLEGREVRRITLHGEKKLTIDVSELSNGIYLITTDGGSPPIRFVKQ